MVVARLSTRAVGRSSESSKGATVVTPFQDRREAGQRLAVRLQHYAGRPDVVVLGLARGGIPVAFEVARDLDAPLDVAVVRKLGVPGQEELAMGAIASGGARVVNDELMSQWAIPAEDLDQVEARERRELQRRERLYRGDRPPIPLKDQTVLLVDDGLATGSTMRAAALAARAHGAKRVVAAAPVAAPDVCARLMPVVDAAICLMEPNPFWAVGIWFEDFRPTTDEEVRELLREAGERTTVDPPPNDDQPDDAARLRAVVKRLDPSGRCLEHLAEEVADARVVIIGDELHDPREFCELRVEITKLLLADHGFRAVAFDTDRTTAERVNRFVLGAGSVRTAEDALGVGGKQTESSWRNAIVRDFVQWLRAFNDQLSSPAKVVVHGLADKPLDRLDALLTTLERPDSPGKVVVWSHDARIVDEAAPNTLGQLARRRYRDDLRLIGLSTYQGASAASHERLFHEVGEPAFLLMLRERCVPPSSAPLGSIGLGPLGWETPEDRLRNLIGGQFDAVIHLDKTTALEPLDRAHN